MPGEPEKPLCVVCGTGSVGLRHLQLMRAASDVRVAALPIRGEREGELAALGFKAIHSWGQAALLGATHAIIATDTRRHGADVMDAVKAGCQVLVEKPMGADAEAARATLNAVRAAGRDLWVGCCLRFQEGLTNFRDRLSHIGRVHSVVVACRSWLPDWRPKRPYVNSYSARAEDGGALRDLIHEIDYCGWLFGWPRAVRARVRNLRRLGIAAEETADLLWETESGTLVTVGLDYVSKPPQRWMRASGEHGWLHWDGLTGTVTVALADGSKREIASRQKPDEMYLAQDLAFVRALPGRIDPRSATGEDGVRALAVCDAARRASESRGEESVQYRD